MNDESTQRRASRPPGRRRLRSGTTLLASVATLGASALGFLAFAPATAFAATAPSNATNLGYTPITPARVCDTRSTTAAGGSDVASGVTGQCANSGTALASGGVLDVAIPTSVVPSGAQAVVLNVTAIGASASGFLSTYAATGAAPTSYISNVNFAAGQDVANSVTVQDNAGAVDVYFGPASPSATVNVAVDVEGYYMTPSATAGDPYTAITPTRVADTRCGTSPAPGYCASENLPSANSSLTTVGANSSINVAVAGVGSVPSTATAVALNVTATNGSAASYLKVYPTGSTPAVTSNQNWMPGETLASQVVSKVGTGGDVSLYNFAGTVDYVVDVTGYYTAAGTSGSLFTSLGAPMRLADTRCAVSPTPSFCSGENLPSANSSLAAPSGGSSITVATGAPSGATSAALDVVDVMPATGNFLTAYPTGASLPVVSTVNWVPGDTYNVVPNAAYATLSSTGDTSIYNGPTNAGAANVVVDMFGYFAPPVTNAVYAVSGPSPSATPTVSTSTTTTGDVTYTVSGLPTASGDTADIALFPATGTDAPVDTNGTWTFTSTGGTGAAGDAAGQATTNDGTAGAYIASVNGVPTAGSGTTEDNGVGTDSGTLSFVLNSMAVDGTVPVVFTQPSTGNNLLAVNANGTPATGYAIGVGAATTWTGAPAALGTYPDEYVQSVNSSANTFQACATGSTLPDTACSSLAPTNTFSYTGTGDSYSLATTGAAVPLSESEFAADLSGQIANGGFNASGTIAGDVVDTAYNPAGGSTFELLQDVPAAPTAVTAAAAISPSTPTVTTDNAVEVSWTAPANQDMTSTSGLADGSTYTVAEATVTNGTVGSFTMIPSSDLVPATNTVLVGTSTAAPTTTVYWTGGTAGTSYEFEVQAVANSSGVAPGYGEAGPASAASAAVTYPVGPSVAPTTPESVALVPSNGTDTVATGSLTTGATLEVQFSSAVDVASNASLSLVGSNGASGTITCGTDASCSGNGTSVVTFTMTAPPVMTTLGTGTGVGTLYFGTSSTTTSDLAVSGETGITNSVGAWNLAQSGFVSTQATAEAAPGIEASGYSPLPTLDASLNPADVTGATVGSSSITVDSSAYPSGLDAGATITAYNTNGVAIGSATVSATTASTTISLSPALSAGETLQLVWTNATSGVSAAQPSVTAQIGVPTAVSSLVFSPTPIATEGTLGDSAPVTVTLTTQPYAMVYLTFGGTSSPGTATVNGTSLSSTETPFQANQSGVITIDYTSSSTATSLTSSDTDTITAQNTATSPTITKTDSYTY